MRRAAALLAAAACLAAGATDRAPAALPEAPAHAFVRSLALKNQLPMATAEERRAGSALLLDEIVVYGQVDPEDYVRRRSRFLAFRDRLAGERPATPKETTQALFCLIGLCGVYGPEGIPLEPTVGVRTEGRTLATTTQLNSMFRGTLQ